MIFCNLTLFGVAASVSTPLLGVVASVCNSRNKSVFWQCSCFKCKAACKWTQHCWPTTPNIVGCYMLRPFAHPVACCWMLLRVVVQSLKPVKLFRQQLRTFLLFRDRWSVAQQCWIRFHSCSNIVGAMLAQYAWFTKSYGLYPSHDALQVPILLGVVASVCRPLPTRTQQLPILLAQQCWELLGPFARSLRKVRIKPMLCKW